MKYMNNIARNLMKPQSELLLLIQKLVKKQRLREIAVS
jgi:hypothetical protein